MYNKTAEDLQKVFEVVDNSIAEGTRLRNWENIVNELNSYFGIQLQ